MHNAGMSNFNPFRFNEVKAGNASYRSLSGLHAFYANRHAGSCPGTRYAEKYTIAGTAGGKAGPLREGPP